MRFNELDDRRQAGCGIAPMGRTWIHWLLRRHLGKVVNTVQGAENLYVEPVTGMPQVIIQYNRPLIAQYHLSIADINDVVNTAFAGQSSIDFEGEKTF